MKKTIKLTEKDLTNMIGRIVKENKTKRKINESNEDLRGEMEDLMADASEIIELMYQFVKKVGDLHDKVEFDIENEDDYVSQSIGDLVHYNDLFYDVLEKSDNL